MDLMKKILFSISISNTSKQKYIHSSANWIEAIRTPLSPIDLSVLNILSPLILDTHTLLKITYRLVIIFEAGTVYMNSTEHMSSTSGLRFRNATEQTKNSCHQNPSLASTASTKHFNSMFRNQPQLCFVKTSHHTLGITRAKDKNHK